MARTLLIFASDLHPMKRFFFFTLFLWACFPVFAQKSLPSEELLHNLVESGFLKSYKDYRSETEMYVALFKARDTANSPSEVIRMQAAYRRTAEAFEEFITITRNDLLNPQKRKTMRKDPEAYVRLRLQTLEGARHEYFEGMFLATYNEIIGAPQPLAAHRSSFIPPEIPLALIIPATKAASDLIELIEKNQERDLLYFKDVLEKEWILPHKFRRWEDI